MDFFWKNCYNAFRKRKRVLCSVKGGCHTMRTAVEWSKYIVTKCYQDDCPISNLQLQKILYYIQKEYLEQGSPAFSDEIEAWQFGPVVPNAYYFFSGFGAMPITMEYPDVTIAPAEQGAINPIVEQKREMDPWDLVAETHREGGAWSRIYNGGAGNHTCIPRDLIRAVG